jgi:sugar phosphate isomerase/epimerase
MLLGYNTNGWAHHDLLDAVEILAEIGYQSVAITIDHHALNPKSPVLAEQLFRLKELLQKWKLESVIETGARYLLDPRRKHEPTLISPLPEGRKQRLQFYFHAVDCAATLGSRCVSIWSGPLPSGTPEELAWNWLLEGLRELLEYAAAKNVQVAFEPEPGMWIDRTTGYQELVTRLGRPDLWLTLDIGHLQCQGELPIGQLLRQWQHALVNIHLEDMCRGRHEHLFFGQGEINFEEVFCALKNIGFQGPVHVELSQHSAQAPVVASEAYRFLQDLLARVLGCR